MVDAVSEPSRETRAQSGHKADPTALLHAYESVLQTARDLPPVVMVPSTYRRRGYRRYIRSLPRTTLLLRFFLVQHIRASLDIMRRRLLAISALGEGRDGDEERLEALTQYMQSLPTYRRTLYSVSFALLTIVVTRFVIVEIPGAMEAFGVVGDQMAVIESLLSAISAASQSVSSLSELLDAIQQAPIETTAFVLTSLATVLYVELRFFVTTFRIKRTLHNLYPQEELLTETPARWSVQRATGVYDLERSVARQLDTRPPREVPFDLIVPALLMPSLALLAALFIQQGLRNMQAFAPTVSPWLSFIIGTAILACVVGRLAWLTRAQLRRLRPDAGPYPPSEVLIHDARLIVAVRDPGTMLWSTAVAAAFCIGIGIAARPGTSVREAAGAAAFLVLTFVVAPVWFRINRDVSAYLAVRDDPRPGYPIVSLLVVAGSGLVAQTLWPISVVCVLTSAYRTAQRVRRAVHIAGRHGTDMVSPALLTVGFVAFPLALAYIQRVLNAVYTSDGDLVDGPTVPTRLAIAAADYSNVSTSAAADEST